MGMEYYTVVVSQLFNTNDLTGMLDRSENDVLAGRLQQYPLLRHKLHLLTGQCAIIAS